MVRRLTTGTQEEREGLVVGFGESWWFEGECWSGDDAEASEGGVDFGVIAVDVVGVPEVECGVDGVAYGFVEASGGEVGFGVVGFAESGGFVEGDDGEVVVAELDHVSSLAEEVLCGGFFLGGFLEEVEEGDGLVLLVDGFGEFVEGSCGEGGVVSTGGDDFFEFELCLAVLTVVQQGFAEVESGAVVEGFEFEGGLVVFDGFGEIASGLCGLSFFALHGGGDASVESDREREEGEGLGDASDGGHGVMSPERAHGIPVGLSSADWVF